MNNDAAEGPASQWNCFSGVGSSCSKSTPSSPILVSPRCKACRSTSNRRSSIHARTAAYSPIKILPPVLGLERRRGLRGILPDVGQRALRRFQAFPA